MQLRGGFAQHAGIQPCVLCRVRLQTAPLSARAGGWLSPASPWGHQPPVLLSARSGEAVRPREGVFGAPCWSW